MTSFRNKGDAMKRTMMGIAVGLVLLSFVPASGARSHVMSRKNELTLMAGAHRFQEGIRRGEQQVVRVGIGRYVTPRNGLEFHATLALRSDANRSFPGSGSTVDADAIVYGIDYFLYFLPRQFQDAKRRLHPFLTVGVGGVDLRRDGAHSDQSMIWGGGIGMKYFFMPRVAFQVAFRRFAASFHESMMSSNEPSHRVRLDALITGLTVSF